MKIINTITASYLDEPPISTSFMSLSRFEKNKIRTALMLELNNCFTRVSKEYRLNGDDEGSKFLGELIASIKECVIGKNDEQGDQD